jgi:hypothetical protein
MQTAVQVKLVMDIKVFFGFRSKICPEKIFLYRLTLYMQLRCSTELSGNYISITQKK